MPQKKIVFKPGVNQENTRYVTEGGWYDCDKVRFRQGFPEKIGGWQPLTTQTYLGICRALWNWITLAGANLIAVGTNLKIYIEEGGAYYDITPLQYQSATISLPANSFTTIAGSQTVKIAIPGLGTSFYLYENDLLNITGITSAVNGIPAADFSQQLTITSVSYSGTPYVTVFLPDAATTSGTGGTACSALYITYWWAQTAVQGFADSQDFYITTTATVAVNDFINLTQPDGSPINCAGVALSGTYQIIAKITSNQFQITSPDIASYDQTVSNTFAQYEINTTTSYVSAVQGWGAGAWSNGSWSFTQADIATTLGIWSIANFGENLIFGRRGGPIYFWKASTGVNTRAVGLDEEYGAEESVPAIQNNIAISDASRFVLALGCNDYGSEILNPMLIRWSDQENPLVWTPTVGNQAGSVQLSHGSTIVGFIQTRQEIVVFTDSSVYSLQYKGPPAVWGAQLVGENTSILGPNAIALASGVVYWMGNGKFYTYNGTVQTLRCDLREFIFSNINTQQNYQVYAGTNEAFNEVWWFYCSANVYEFPDTYVIYNYIDDAWYFGYMPRTAWLDVGLLTYPVAAYPVSATGTAAVPPYAANPTGYLLNHESGTNDNTVGTPVAMNSYIQTAEFDIDDGDRFSFVWQMLPDVRFNGSDAGTTPSVTMTLSGLQNSGSGLNNQSVLSGGGQNTNPVIQSTAPVPANYNYTSVVVEQFTGTVPCRVRGRQLIFRVESADLGVQWQLGAPRINIKPDGRRGNT